LRTIYRSKKTSIKISCNFENTKTHKSKSILNLEPIAICILIYLEFYSNLFYLYKRNKCLFKKWFISWKWWANLVYVI